MAIDDELLAPDTACMGSQTSPAAICICTPAVQHKSCSITCFDCTKPIYVLCLLQQFQQAGGAAARNNLEWIKDFVTCTGLRYRCPTCQQDARVSSALPSRKSQPGNSTDNLDTNEAKGKFTTQVNNLQDTISDISQQLANLQRTVALLVPTEAQSAPLSSLPPAKQSYAAATSDLTKAVKTAVNESIREQRAADREQKLVAIYNLRKCGDDVKNISELCEYTDCNVHVVKAIRIGQQPKKSPPRLLRVELSSAAEKSCLLKAS